MASRDTKTDIFQEGSAGFKATIGLNKKKVHPYNVSAYVENVDLISLRQTYNYREHEGRNDKDGRKLLLDVLKLFGISRRERIPNYRVIYASENNGTRREKFSFLFRPIIFP
jgi:hypothetical protein